MASITSEDESENCEDNLSIASSTSNFSTVAVTKNKTLDNSTRVPKVPNIATRIFNREIYGNLGKGPNGKTDQLFENVHRKCKYSLHSLIKDTDCRSHIFMGFTLCGQYFLSFAEKHISQPYRMPLEQYEYEYELFIWRFNPGEKLTYYSTHKIFNYAKGNCILDRIIFMQFPNDTSKLICYGYDNDFYSNVAEVFHISIVTLPSPNNCIHCHGSLQSKENGKQGWCSKHGFVVHYMFPTIQTPPIFDPKISLSFPDYLVINTGHHIHILNVISSEPPVQNDCTSSSSLPASFVKDDDSKTTHYYLNDTLSEVSESVSDNGCNSSVIEAILEDFSEYDLESSEGGKPFHELNISCEPLNVAGKSYHNTLVQNIFDPRIKRLTQNSTKEYVFSVPSSSQKSPAQEKSKVDKKIAEKEYEFIEENDKYEKISLFRKKRLADKKYEFSEDNTENIVPFHILRRERRYLYRSQNRNIRSPDCNTLFLSPKSPGWRSPMQSPNSRNGQFSPSAHIYCTSVRNSPYHSKSPISPRPESQARKVNVYSPNLDGSDCSDYDGRLVLRTPINFSNSQITVDTRFNQNGLLIVDPKRESPKWIKKIVRRYSNGDFENSSLLSGQSRDDDNIPIEVPIVVQSLNDQQFDIIPESRMDHLTERQIIVTQRSMDCEQFVQRRAQAICIESNLQFMYCEDYDIKLEYICPVSGEILCKAVIKIGALKTLEPKFIVETYWTHFLFTWNICTNEFDVIESDKRLTSMWEEIPTSTGHLPTFNCKEPWVLTYDISKPSMTSLRDSRNNFEICLLKPNDTAGYYGFNPFLLTDIDYDTDSSESDD
ncbi:hypothetical protein ABEB36_012915 [Hypothenemus hampei]|uniref:DDB1- and CUL4-associated factor 15 WD40 repeat-containing domain-containing protein n=1 Tax=Hypothenemus hampei TaxID=57062 RepID=A0ABD1EAP2_HYPHA